MLKLKTTGRRLGASDALVVSGHLPTRDTAEPRKRDWSNSLAIIQSGLRHYLLAILFSAAHPQAVKLASSNFKAHGSPLRTQSASVAK